MFKKFDPLKFNKLAKVLETMMSVLYVTSVISLLGLVIMGILSVTLPSHYFNIEHFINESFRFELNGMLRYDISISKLPEETNLREIYKSIAGAAFMYALALMRIFKLLKDLLKTVVEGVPFHKDNPSRLINIAAVVIGASFLFPALNELVSGRMIEIFMLKGFSLNYSADLFLMFVGLLLLILAGIFRYGCYLQNEYDETL